MYNTLKHATVAETHNIKRLNDEHTDVDTGVLDEL